MGQARGAVDGGTGGCELPWRRSVSEDERGFFELSLKRETAMKTIRLRSPQVQYRGYLVLKMKKVVERLRMGSYVLHAAVRLLDIFMDNHNISEDTLIVVAFSCLYIIVKFELEGQQMPCFADICRFSNTHDISKDSLLYLEFKILDFIDWNLCMPNVTTFLSFFEKYALSVDDYNHWRTRVSAPFNTFKNLQNIMKRRLKSYLSITLLDMNLTFFYPSVIAAACLLASRQSLNLELWPKDLEFFHIHSYVYTLATRLTKMLEKTEVNLHNKRRYSDYVSDDDNEDQGYCTGKSSPEDSAKKVRRIY